MNNERFDHIEERIREAAMQSEPPFNELAWEKMEKKLDEEPDRKRPVFWWMFASLLLLATLTAAIFVFNNSSTRLASVPATTTGDRAIVNDPGNSPVPRDQANSEKSDLRDQSLDGALLNPQIDPAHESESFKGYEKGRSGKSEAQSMFKIKAGAATEDASQAVSIDSRSSEPSADIHAAPSRLNETDASATGLTFIDTLHGEQVYQVNEKTDRLEGIDSSEVATNISLSSDRVNDKRKKSRSSRFYFIASAGPELTAVKPGNANGRDISMRYGIGVGYQLTRRIALQTGFYSVAKKYVAGKDDYDPKDASYISGMDDLVVDADCRVFEIPLSIRYTFRNKGRNNFFASAGLAGALMKREDYKFTYTQGTYPYIATYTNEKAFTGNRHFISFLQLSGGLARKLSNTVSVIAEPYLTMPLQGVGEGRVKLFSAGVQFGISYTPVKK